jgi:hypothetical protein
LSVQRLAVQRLALQRLAVQRWAVQRLAAQRLAVQPWVVQRWAVQHQAVQRWAMQRWAMQRVAAVHWYPLPLSLVFAPAAIGLRSHCVRCSLPLRLLFAPSRLLFAPAALGKSQKFISLFFLSSFFFYSRGIGKYIRAGDSGGNPKMQTWNMP